MKLELFPCSGGMAEGFRRAGITFDMSFDWSCDACDSYEKNLGHRPIQMDVRDLVRMAIAGWRPGRVDLVARATRWVRARHYPIVLADVRTIATSEQPDVIGFRTGGDTLLVECKASLEDFKRDASKPFRREPGSGMGYFRWYFAPAGIVLVDALPPSWGLAEVGARGKVAIAKRPQPFHQRNLAEEARLLVTALRRATEGWGRGIFGDADPHPKVTAELRELRKENRRLRISANAAAMRGGAA
ncbi:MAG TPA: hypothetical protein VGH28_13975 [Polyangiaceae bacterium]